MGNVPRKRRNVPFLDYDGKNGLAQPGWLKLRCRDVR